MERRTDSARVDPLSRGFAYAVVGGLVVVAIASFCISFSGLTAFARDQIGLRSMPALLPVVIDTSILVFGASVILNTARRENAFAGWLLLVFSTTLSASMNAAHVIADGPAPGALPAWAAPAVAATVPFFLLASTEVAIRTVVRVHPADDAPADTATPEPAHVPTETPVDQPVGPASEPQIVPVEPAAEIAPVEPTPIRPKSKRKPTTRSRSTPAASASAVPADREAEVARLIDVALDAGLSRQAAADRVAAQTGLSISKSRVTRRAQARAQQQTQEAAA